MTHLLRGPWVSGLLHLDLSENGIGIFIVSTFDGDHLLVSRTDSERACALLAAAGHTVLPAIG